MTYTTVNPAMWLVFRQWAKAHDLAPIEVNFVRFAWREISQKLVEARAAYNQMRPRPLNNTPAYYDAMLGRVELMWAQLYALWLCKFRHMTHYFLEEGISEFCVGAVRGLTPDYIRTFPDCRPIAPSVEIPAGESRTFKMQSLYSEHRLSAANSTIPLSTLVPNRSVASSGFVVHFPDTERQHSMVVMPNVLVGILPDVWRSYQFCAWDGDTVATVSSTTRRHEGLTALQERFLRTLYGLSLYLEAFPDTVQKADPHDFAGDTERHGETVRVTRNDHVQVAEGHKHGMSAHWRSGFYRMYPDDERWPNARGKVIWIEPTFVRGSAMEILEDGEENPVYHIGSGQLEAVAVNQ